MKNTDKWVIEYPNYFRVPNPSKNVWGTSVLSNKIASFEHVVAVMTRAIQMKSFDNIEKYRLRNVVTNEVILWETLSVIILNSSPENM